MPVDSVEAIPLEHTLDTAFGGTRDLASQRVAMLVRLETDGGEVGWGETLAPPRTTAAAVEEIVSDVVLGREPYAVESLANELYAGTYPFGNGPIVHCALSAVDIALWDLRGKLTGEPIHRLLGATTDAGFLEGHDPTAVVPYAMTMYITEADRDPADAIRDALGEGYTAVKIKAGLGVEADAERVATAREVLGDDVPLMVDFNGNYRPDIAARVADALEPYGVAWLEEPLPPENTSGYRELKQETTIPIAAGEAHTSRFEFAELVETRAVDVVQPNVTRCGGFSEARFVGKLAATQNVGVHSSTWNSAVGFAAALQFAATLPTYPHAGALPEPRFFGVDRGENPLREDLLVDPLELTGEQIEVPDDPGLGVEVDEDAIEAYRID